MTWGELAERLADRPGDDILVARVRRILWVKVAVVVVVVVGVIDGRLVGYVAEASSPAGSGIHAVLGDQRRARDLLGRIMVAGEALR